MESYNLLDHNVKYTFKKKTNLRVIYAIIIIIILSWTCIYFTVPAEGEIQHLDGTYSSNAVAQKGLFWAVIFSFPLFGIFIGALASIFPFKKLKYNQKIVRFILVSILIIESLALLSVAIGLLRYLFEF